MKFRYYFLNLGPATHTRVGRLQWKGKLVPSPSFSDKNFIFFYRLLDLLLSNKTIHIFVVFYLALTVFVMTVLLKWTNRFYETQLIKSKKIRNQLSWVAHLLQCSLKFILKFARFEYGYGNHGITVLNSAVLR